MIKIASNVDTSKYKIIFVYTTFIFIVVEISSLAGSSLIKNAPSPPSLFSTPLINYTSSSSTNSTDYNLSGASMFVNFGNFLLMIYNIISYGVMNITYFITLMAISTEYLLLGSLLFAPYSIVMAFLIYDSVAELIP